MMIGGGLFEDDPPPVDDYKLIRHRCSCTGSLTILTTFGTPSSNKFLSASVDRIAENPGLTA